MGLEDEVDVTDDIGTADAILACGSEMKKNPWIRGVAKFHQLPIFVMKVPSCVIISVYKTVSIYVSGCLIWKCGICFAVKHYGTNGEGSSHGAWKGIIWLFVETTL